MQQRSLSFQTPPDPTPAELSYGEGGTPAQVVSEAVRALRGLSYGIVTLTVKDGQVVQLECAEKRRVLPKP